MTMKHNPPPPGLFIEACYFRTCPVHAESWPVIPYLKCTHCSYLSFVQITVTCLTEKITGPFGMLYIFANEQFKDTNSWGTNPVIFIQNGNGQWALYVYYGHPWREWEAHWRTMKFYFSLINLISLYFEPGGSLQCRVVSFKALCLLWLPDIRSIK